MNAVSDRLERLTFTLPLGYDRTERVAWGVALVMYGLADVVGTIGVLEHARGFEEKVIVWIFVEHLGYAGLFVNKIAAIGLAYLIWRYYPDPWGVGVRPFRLVVPALLAGRGVHLAIIHAVNLSDLYL